MNEEYDEIPRIKLPKSRLLVVGDSLVKRAPDGAAIGRHKFSEIRDVAIIKKISPVAILVTLVCLALAVVAKKFIEDPMWSWIVFGFFALLTVFSLLLIQGYKMRISFNRDEELLYEVNDPPDEAQSFAISMREILRESRTPEN